MRVLAADVGGTKTLLALFERRGDAWHELARRRYPSAEHAALEAVLDAFAGDTGGELSGLDAAAFALAGPVHDDRCDTTNLPWHVSGQALSRRLGAPVRLLNDFSAVAHGIEVLGPEDLCVLQEGEVDPAGARVILGAGTGLGVAVALPGAGGLRVLDSEGGHAALAPASELERRLAVALARERGRASVEDVVSGPGLLRIHRFLVAEGDAPECTAVRDAATAGEDASAVIAAHADAGHDPACEAALAAFVGAYGNAAGNLALNVVPAGGLYVAGGIAPKILDALRGGGFMRAFLDKAPMQPLLSRVRVQVVTCADVGLLGARQQAAMLSSRGRGPG